MEPLTSKFKMLKNKLNNINLANIPEPDSHPPKNTFVLKYNDINNTQKRSLATSIKDCAHQYRIRKSNGPNIETIQEALTIINPIIFAQHPNLADLSWLKRYNGYRTFGTHNTDILIGWRFKHLSRAIYKITCIKRPLTKNEIMNIAYLTSRNYQGINDYINDQYSESETPPNPTTISRLQEIGIEDIHKTRKQTEKRPNNISEDTEIILNPDKKIPHLRKTTNSPYGPYFPYIND